MRSVSLIERFTRSRLDIEPLPTPAAIRHLQAEKLLESFRSDLKNTELDKEKEIVKCLLDEGHKAEDIAAVVLHRILPKQEVFDEIFGEDEPERKHKRRKRRDRPNASRDPRKRRRPEVQRAGAKRPPKKKKISR
jgi:hypothetical protein